MKQKLKGSSVYGESKKYFMRNYFNDRFYSYEISPLRAVKTTIDQNPLNWEIFISIQATLISSMRDKLYIF